MVSSVAVFVNAEEQPQQCEIVDQEAFSPGDPSPGCCKQENRCGAGQANQVCNCRGNVGSVLGDYNLTNDPSGRIPTADDFEAITQQIDASSVVVIQVVDSENAAIAHVMAITGYSGNDTVCVVDPADTDSLFTYSYSNLLNPMPGAPSNSNWRLVRLFTTIPGPSGG